MKQTIFMAVVTSWGVVGPIFDPSIGVAVYYLFAVLRPQYLWQWALPPDISWSLYVALATIGGILVVGIGGGAIKPMQERWDRWLNTVERETASRSRGTSGWTR